MNQVDLKKMEALGWRWYQTGPNEGEWLKYCGDTEEKILVATQGSATWRMDLDRCMPTIDRLQRAHLYIRFEADMHSSVPDWAWEKWVVGQLTVPTIARQSRATAQVTMYGAKDAKPLEPHTIDNRDGRPGGPGYNYLRPEPHPEGYVFKDDPRRRKS